MANIDIYFDVGNSDDIVFDEYGDFRWTQTVQESLSQRLNIRYKTWLGEWRYNTEFGTPYRQRIRLGGYTESELKAEFISIALEEEDVISAKFSSFSWDRENRTMTGTLVVITEDGEITIPTASVYTAQNIYPEPYQSASFSFCDLDSLGINLSDVNKVHLLVQTLLEGGINSWYKEDAAFVGISNSIHTVLDSIQVNEVNSWYSEWSN
jgi:hypothetical protein